MKKEKIYISGKISGLTEKEYKENFAKAKRILMFTQSLGYDQVLDPTTIKPLFGIKRWFFYMANDLRAQRKCTHSAFQENWIDSKRAVIEYFFAKFIFKQEILYL